MYLVWFGNLRVFYWKRQEILPMKFYRSLYVGESIRQVNKVKWKLRVGAGQFSIYLIALSNNDDQLDIFHCSQLKQKYFDKRNLYVVGLAKGKDEAYQLVGRMLADTLRAGMGGDIKAYLLQNISRDREAGK